MSTDLGWNISQHDSCVDVFPNPTNPTSLSTLSLNAFVLSLARPMSMSDTLKGPYEPLTCARHAMHALLPSTLTVHYFAPYNLLSTLVPNTIHKLCEGM